MIDCSLVRGVSVSAVIAIAACPGFAQDAKDAREQAVHHGIELTTRQEISSHIPLMHRPGRVAGVLRVDTSTLDSIWAKGKLDQALAAADAMIAANKKDYRGYALRYLAYLELKNDRVLAGKEAVKAFKALRGNVKATTAFVQKALFVNPTTREYQTAHMALQPLIADSPSYGPLRVANVRALLGCRKVRAAMAMNRTIIKDLEKDPVALMDLARAICDTEGGRALGAMARKAFDTARKHKQPQKATEKQTDEQIEEEESNQELRELEVQPRSQLDQAEQILLFRILYHLEGNKRAAEKVVKGVHSSVGHLNNWVWYLMTRRESAKRYRTIALYTAKRMLEDESERASGASMDTIALAFYRNGLYKKALEHQEQALKVDSSPSAGMQKRLELYRKLVALRGPGAADGAKATSRAAGTSSRPAKR